VTEPKTPAPAEPDALPSGTSPREHTLRMPPLLVLASLVVIVAGLRAASAFFVDILSALLLTIVLAPAVTFLQRRAWPKTLAVSVITLGLIGAGIAVGAIVGHSAAGFTHELPARAHAFEAAETRLFAALEETGLVRIPEGGPLDSFLDAHRIAGLFGRLFVALQAMLSNGFVILMLVVFGLLQAGRTRAKLEGMVGRESRVPGALEQFAGHLFEYLKVKSLMSLGTGVGVTVVLLALGVEYAGLWGLLAFLLNFVPNVGSVLAAIPPIALAAVDLGAGRGALVAVAIITVNFLFSNVLEPRLMGRSFGLSPWTVFAALLFWAYVLGPMGMVLAIPLTVAVKLGLEMSDRTQWIATLMA
jgi:AI-2 transport protein TqsA